MLTNVYYYNIYKPYLVGNRETNVYSPRRQRIADRKESPEPSGQIYVLNKSLKDEIVNYAHNVSYGVTGLRSSVRQTAFDMENFNRNIQRDGYDRAQGYLADDLEAFAGGYNQAAAFMQAQTHSANLRTFSYEFADNLNYNRERLSLLGISVSEEGGVSFDREAIKGMTHEKINVAIGENISLFNGLLRHAGDFLTDPLVDHMKFKGLGYHYNYKMGNFEADGFNAIEAGLLIDKAV